MQWETLLQLKNSILEKYFSGRTTPSTKLVSKPANIKQDDTATDDRSQQKRDGLRNGGGEVVELSFPSD